MCLFFSACVDWILGSPRHTLSWQGAKWCETHEFRRPKCWRLYQGVSQGFRHHLLPASFLRVQESCCECASRRWIEDDEHSFWLCHRIHNGFDCGVCVQPIVRREQERVWSHLRFWRVCCESSLIAHSNIRLYFSAGKQLAASELLLGKYWIITVYFYSDEYLPCKLLLCV